MPVFAVGATEGYIYLRSEYPFTRIILEDAIANAETAGYLGKDIQGSGKDFTLEVFMGAGAYICGEETSSWRALKANAARSASKPPRLP